MPGIQAVPMKYILKRTISCNRCINRVREKLTVADQTHTVTLLQGGAAEGAVGNVVTIPQPLQIRLHDALPI